MSELILLEGVRKSYRNGAETLTVFADLDLKIAQGSAVVITGESGSGKSTLLHLLGGMDRPSEGLVQVGGLDLGKAAEAKIADFRKKTIGFVFQFHHLLKDFTALENVMMPALMLGSSRDAARPRALDLLDRVGIVHRGDAFPNELSGGERQRAAVARALMNDPALLLADEPTGSLDEEHSRGVEELLFSLSRDLSKTLVLVTHNRRLANYADLHLRLSKGELRPIEVAAE